MTISKLFIQLTLVILAHMSGFASRIYRHYFEFNRSDAYVGPDLTLKKHVIALLQARLKAKQTETVGTIIRSTHDHCKQCIQNDRRNNR